MASLEPTTAGRAAAAAAIFWCPMLYQVYITTHNITSTRNVNETRAQLFGFLRFYSFLLVMVPAVSTWYDTMALLTLWWGGARSLLWYLVGVCV